MDWTIISEGIISTVVGTVISSAILFIAKIIFYKNNKLPEKQIEIPLFKDIFLISLFLTSFIIILTFFSLIYSWGSISGYLLVASVLMGSATTWAYNNQCPKCKAVFHGKKLLNKETLRSEKRPYNYRNEIRYLYNDGSIKDRKFVGPQKTMMETWRIEKEHYGCDSCSYTWEKTFERNIDIGNRPKPEIHKTSYRNPEFEIN